MSKTTYLNLVWCFNLCVRRTWMMQLALNIIQATLTLTIYLFFFYTGTEDSSSMMNNGVMQDIGNLANSVTGESPSYGKACAGCGGRILDRFLLHAMERYWHTGCLKCSCCQTNLEQLGSCFTRSGMILCKNDYLR